MEKRVVYALATVTTIALLLVVIAAAFTAGMFAGPYLNLEAQAATIPQDSSVAVPQAGEPGLQVEQAEVLGAYEAALIELYRASIPSVVNVNVTARLEQQLPQEFNLPSPFLPFPGLPEQSEEPQFQRGQGSGFVWDEEGHIVTNYHVVANAEKVEVVFADGARVEAEVLGTDPNSDLAVLLVDADDVDNLQPLPRGDADNLRVGQVVVALGNPFGQEFTMTHGIISAIGRTIQSGNAGFSIPQVIQTDAPINPGNSGGPLIDSHGRIIGINTMILSRNGASSGVGFAIPIDIAEQVIPTLIRGERYEYAWLGLTGTTLLPEVADFMDLPEDTRGVLVIEVAKDGPADKAGLEGSDKTLTVAGERFQLGGTVITAINGEPVETIDELVSYLVSKTRPGEEVELQVITPDGEEELVSVTLGTRPGLEELAQGTEQE